MAVSGWVRDEEAEVVSCQGVVLLPSFTRVLSTDSPLGRVHVITFRRRHDGVWPGGIVLFIVLAIPS